MATMLEVLHVHDGHRVLEIGTGTGYNAALLCHRLGEANVVSIDIDADLVDAARAALDLAGYRPTLLTGDGALGAPEHAPFDRIIATCGLDRIPPAWLGQIRTGGVIVANIGFGLVRLTVAEDGSAEGPFIGPAAFMHIRPDVDGTAFTHRDALSLSSGSGVTRTAPLPTDLDAQPVGFLRRVIMSGVEPVTIHTDDGDVYCLADPVTGSWVRASPRGNGDVDLVERGPRQLWDELERVVDSWHTADRPGIDRFGLMITPDGTQILSLLDSDWAVALPRSSR